MYVQPLKHPKTRATSGDWKDENKETTGCFINFFLTSSALLRPVTRLHTCSLQAFRGRWCALARGRMCVSSMVKRSPIKIVSVWTWYLTLDIQTLWFADTVILGANVLMDSHWLRFLFCYFCSAGLKNAVTQKCFSGFLGSFGFWIN